MKHYYAEEVEVIELAVGETFALESLREAVRPPYLMLLPFVEVPAGVEVLEQRALGVEGVHGVTFVLRATRRLDEALTVGFRDVRTGEITSEKVLQIISTGDRSSAAVIH